MIKPVFFQSTIALLLIGICIAGCTSTAPPAAPAPAAPAVTTDTPTGAPVPSGTWTFVVFGDSRDLVRDTKTGVSPYLIPIAEAVAAEKPELVIYNGDLVSGWMIANESPVATDYKAQFRNWMEMVAPIHNYTTGSGVPIYVVRGNHEDGPDPEGKALTDAYLASVAAGMPRNGPPGEEHLTYSFTHKGAKFIGIDEYMPHDGKKETVNQTWVDQELSTDTRPFMFVFGHTPAFLVKDDYDDRGLDIAIHPNLRDIFWQSLVEHNATAYFSGHAHIYVRGQKDGVQQVVAGNGGAVGSAFNQSEADPVLRIEYPVKPEDKVGDTVGYLVITVNEKEETLNAVQKIYFPETKTWKDGDRFTLSRKGAAIPVTQAPK